MSTIEKAAERLAAKAAEASKAADAAAQAAARASADAEPATEWAGSSASSERPAIAPAPGLMMPSPSPFNELPEDSLADATEEPVDDFAQDRAEAADRQSYRQPNVQPGLVDIAGLLADEPEHQVELDFDALTALGFLTPDSGRSTLSQEFRKIKRQVLNRLDLLEAGLGAEEVEYDRSQELGTAPFNTLMVSSALAGEGKTYVSINLAVSLAGELDREVLLIDGDMAKADVSRHLGLSDRVGFGQILRDPSLINEAILATNIPRLSVIPAGVYQDNLDELLASELMGELVVALAEQNPERIVLFDAPPLLVTTEAAVLSRHLRQVLLVVEANRTPKDAVLQAVRELGQHRNVLMVLNKISGGSRFGYGYGYGYEHNAKPGGTQSQEVAVAQPRTHS